MNEILYLSRADVERFVPRRSILRDALAQAIRDTKTGSLKFLPKSTLPHAVGHSFQSMLAMHSEADGSGAASIKWVSVVPTAPQSALENVQSIICLNDLQSGLPLAIMDGNHITLVRTAALSALAAQHMVAGEPRTIGFVGCGKQALEHLHAFHDLYPGLQRAICFSRSPQSARGLADEAGKIGLEAESTGDADHLLEWSDIVISTVPAAPGLVPFLDARRMKDHALAVMVDLGRTWIEDGFSAFSQIVTDSLQQGRHPYDNLGNELETAEARADLEGILHKPLRVGGRKAFFFKGIASADLAVAWLVYRNACDAGGGIPLAR